MAKLTLKTKTTKTPPPGDLEQEAKQELDAATQAFKTKKLAEQALFSETTDSEFWVALCFQTRVQKEEFLSKIGVLSEGDKYLDGLKVAEAIGIKIESPGIPTRKLNISKRWQTLIRE